MVIVLVFVSLAKMTLLFFVPLAYTALVLVHAVHYCRIGNSGSVKSFCAVWLLRSSVLNNTAQPIMQTGNPSNLGRLLRRLLTLTGFTRATINLGRLTSFTRATIIRTRTALNNDNYGNQRKINRIE